jgi:hypothetical protein
MDALVVSGSLRTDDKILNGRKSGSWVNQRKLHYLLAEASWIWKHKRSPASKDEILEKINKTKYQRPGQGAMFITAEEQVRRCWVTRCQ